MRSRKGLLFYALFAALIVVADQITKLLVLNRIPLFSRIAACYLSAHRPTDRLR